MKVVIDTNIILMSLPKISKYRPIFDALLASKYDLAITEDILYEYIEIIGNKTNSSIAQNFGKLFSQLENVEKKEIYFRWNLITSDPDDNKFVDCAIASNVTFLVTNDRHFNGLKDLDFPKVDIIDAEGFLEEVLKLFQ